MNNTFGTCGLVVQIELIGRESFNYSNYLCLCVSDNAIIDSSYELFRFLTCTIFSTYSVSKLFQVYNDCCFNRLNLKKESSCKSMTQTLGQSRKLEVYLKFFSVADLQSLKLFRVDSKGLSWRFLPIGDCIFSKGLLFDCFGVDNY